VPACTASPGAATSDVATATPVTLGTAGAATTAPAPIALARTVYRNVQCRDVWRIWRRASADRCRDVRRLEARRVRRRDGRCCFGGWWRFGGSSADDADRDPFAAQRPRPTPRWPWTCRILPARPARPWYILAGRKSTEFNLPTRASRSCDWRIVFSFKNIRFTHVE
jgi:hypothetical protein